MAHIKHYISCGYILNLPSLAWGLVLPAVFISNELIDKIIGIAESIEEIKDKQNQLDKK
ncbi:hypothetical protein [Photorhabdus khanii]|uniref:hypothetical protein n=1 Tax=Photorhabdus khanii TaxID=1004150 RepID=UPI001863F71C|nr:hypothetical protein [Photorhabdus khanii]